MLAANDLNPAFLTVHVHNPEGVEIGSFSGQPIVLFSNLTTHSAGGVISGDHQLIRFQPGNYLASVTFNGMTKTQPVTLLSGKYTRVAFQFDRQEWTFPSFGGSWETSVQTNIVYEPDDCCYYGASHQAGAGSEYVGPFVARVGGQFHVTCCGCRTNRFSVAFSGRVATLFNLSSFDFAIETHISINEVPAGATIAAEMGAGYYSSGGMPWSAAIFDPVRAPVATGFDNWYAQSKTTGMYPEVRIYTTEGGWRPLTKGFWSRCVNPGPVWCYGSEDLPAPGYHFEAIPRAYVSGRNCDLRVDPPIYVTPVGCQATETSRTASSSGRWTGTCELKISSVPYDMAGHGLPTDPAAEATGVYGTILSAATGKPVPWAMLSFDGYDYYTGAEGTYDFEYYPAGEYWVSIYYDGYRYYEGQVTVPKGTKSRRDIELTPIQPVVVLVRGLHVFWEGNPQDYWRETAAALESDFEVWDCNTITGKDSVAVEASRLHDFIEKKLQERQQDGVWPPDSISLLAHSYGGLIARYYLHHYMNIVKRVVMLSGANCGSELATKTLLLESALAALPHVPGLPSAAEQLWCDNRKALECLTPDYVQHKFNAYLCNDRDPRQQFYLFGGTGGAHSGDSTLREGWAFLYLEVVPHSQANDGAVTVNSAQGSALVRMGVHEGPDAYLPVKMVGKSGTSTWTTRDDHTTLKQDPNTLALVRHALLGEPSPAQALVKPASVASSAASVPVALVAGTVQRGQNAMIPIWLDQCQQARFDFEFVPEDLTVAFVGPSNQPLDLPQCDPQVTFFAPGGPDLRRKSYCVEQPVPGHWQVLLTGSFTNADDALWRLQVSQDSEIELHAVTEYLQSGNQAHLAAQLTEGGRALAGGTISARIIWPDEHESDMVLWDDGAHGDGDSGDGLYGNDCNVSGYAGAFQVLYEATGTNQLGQTFSRVGGGEFEVAPAAARLTGSYADRGVDTRPTPGLEELVIDVGVQVVRAGKYALSGLLTDGTGVILASASSAFFSVAAGRTTNLTLHFSGSTLQATGKDGPYRRSEVALWYDSGDTVYRVDYVGYAGSTKFYAAKNFVDGTAPEGIADLTVEKTGPGRVTLRWTAPSHQGGKASAYELRYLNDSFSADKWYYGYVLPNPPLPSAPGIIQTYEVTGLAEGCGYWFAINSRDQAGNLSEVSNFASILLASPLRFISARVTGPGLFEVQLTGDAGLSYVIETTTDFSDWRPMQTNRLRATNLLSFTAAIGTNAPGEFYRAVARP